ncbi:hypothetical protein [Pseudomonas sp. GM80]|jgi:hypothetical protein|uniref:hypothetical protein n=1 Tax=Pseudomonas sp. GM80 TaxID=1144339 RepID=UPI00026F7224|nr:hypothetical protein [Pseudomonas sp. GM80]EJN22718.1 hypothetical protein PMI37_04930 [Pseudomonas sp. GM80]
MARKQASSSIALLQHQLEREKRAVTDLSKVRFEPIDTLAVNASLRWETPQFCWREVMTWKAREPLSLDFSIWFEDELCGLCFANPNNSRRRIRIVRLEGRSGEAHPLKNRIGTLALIVIEQYARIIGSEVLEVQEPLVGAISHYQELGFRFDAQGCLVKNVGNRVS